MILGHLADEDALVQPHHEVVEAGRVERVEQPDVAEGVGDGADPLADPGPAPDRRPQLGAERHVDHEDRQERVEDAEEEAGEEGGGEPPPPQRHQRERRDDDEGGEAEGEEAGEQQVEGRNRRRQRHPRQQRALPHPHPHHVGAEADVDDGRVLADLLQCVDHRQRQAHPRQDEPGEGQQPDELHRHRVERPPGRPRSGSEGGRGREDGSTVRLGPNHGGGEGRPAGARAGAVRRSARRPGRLP
ncbi:hypothetical protein [Acuticoccus sp. I52.16.1]|uniref:hypothetical protein n=1 Tax=Acuticoccus sp. I52.16.1 TaxID=2928472 RepID=UPI001FD47F3E|nr:hypothetical protein [Acuticoccus sp. I52.16.1]UOM37213.1 hypothetical protein MRB58_23920 [Acuticoccus sp. I52.16.1]